jgi:hypothetical protein
MKSTLLIAAVFLYVLSIIRTDASSVTHIQVISSYFKGDISEYPYHVLQLRIVNPTYFDIKSQTELVLFNSDKSFSKKPIIHQNREQTIVGFDASVARASYKIILVYVSDKGETVINQNFNLEVADVLRKASTDTKFDADGLFLDDIQKRILRIGFQSDSGKGSFKFQVQLTPDGKIQMVPKSLVFDN